uniref:RHS repeat domain-containing protein n=1 Tax=uncultured Dysgonomonas sp. TaxID=206096 RepID=UPI00261BD157|nr:RHS repeat-associated core domain-containing protein [uncultured Dysgonomonas sp.]
MFDNGYYQDGNYYFYVRDHLGNNRLVTDAAASVVQSNHYYPFGMSFAESTNQEKQPYKYNNKELDDRAGLNWYDYSARMKDDWGFMMPDPHSENYYSWSPYVYVGNNPILNIDPDGKDYWSTNDPNQIRAFLNSVGAGSNTHDFTGWNHATDAEFSANLTYNDETNKFYTSYGTVENGEATIVGVSFDANITPKTQDSYSDIIGKGMQVYKPRSGVLDYISYYLFGIGESYTDGINNWSVSASGHITGIKKVTVTPPSVSPVGSLAPKTIKSISPHAVNQSITRGGGF